jgi:predicted NodU family carbamoyl transferase
VNEGEYKVMGMAPFGMPKYRDKVYKLIRTSKDGSFELDMDYFSFHHSTHQTYNEKVDDTNDLSADDLRRLDCFCPKFRHRTIYLHAF